MLYFYINNIVITRIAFVINSRNFESFNKSYTMQKLSTSCSVHIIVCYVLRPQLVIVVEKSDSTCRCNKPVACRSSSLVFPWVPHPVHSEKTVRQRKGDTRTHLTSRLRGKGRKRMKARYNYRLRLTAVNQ